MISGKWGLIAVLVRWTDWLVAYPKVRCACIESNLSLIATGTCVNQKIC
jgi:hypothetical protein